MLATIRIARVLAPEGYGQYSLVQTIAGLGVVLAGLGFRNVVIRECARHPDRSADVFFATGVLRALSLGAVGLGIFVYGQISHQGFSAAFSAVAIGLLVGLSAWELVENVAFGHERMEYSAGINLAGSAAWVIAALVAPKAWLTPFNVSLAFALLQGLKALVYAGIGRGAGYFQGHIRPSTQRVLWISLLQQSMPFYWIALLGAATNQLPIIFLAERSGRAEVGLYNVGFRLVNPLLMLASTALTALYPGLAKAGVSDDERFMWIVRRALLGITLLGTLGALAVSLLRQELILLLFGTSYRASADAMAFQCWYLVLLAIYSLIGTTLAARDRQRWLAWLSTIYAASSIIILWLGAGGGAAGLARAILGTAVIGLVYHWIAFQHTLPKRLTTSFTLGLVGVFGGGLTIAGVTPLTVPLRWRFALCAGSLAVLVVGVMLARRR